MSVRTLPVGPARVASFAVYCVSCVTMAVGATVALLAAIGVAATRPVATPFDAFLDTWAMPLLVLSVLGLLWTNRAVRTAFAVTALGGIVSVAAMAMPMGTGSDDASLGPTTGMEGMDAMDGAHSDGGSTGMVPRLGVALLFWAGTALLTSGTILAWRARRAASRGVVGGRVRPPRTEETKAE